MESIMKDFGHLVIELEEIKSATDNFNESKVIGHGGFGKVYKGEVCHSKGRSMAAFKHLDRKFGQGEVEFLKEIRTLVRYRHENIISLLGFCKRVDERANEMILVYEYVSGGSLDTHLNSTTLTWTQRIKICRQAAEALSFLHDPKWTNQRLIHRDIKSANILLDENLNAKVSDFGLSKNSPANQKYSGLVTDPAGTVGYCDPQCAVTYSVTKESDVYSFGVVLFEVLCGRLCNKYINGQWISSVPLWKDCYHDNKLDEIIFKDLKQQINPDALETFANIAYQCLERLPEKRPLMSHVVEKLKKLENALIVQVFEHLVIELEKIKSATDNFNDSKVIGCGGYGKVYKGEVCHSKGRSMAAFKRLDRKQGEGNFLIEIMTLDCYRHENIISLLGFCNRVDERANEMILVLEHASHGSLDTHLNSTTLTWTQCIKICLQAAKALSFLHDPNGTNLRLIHCDIKSANILLDENLNAKVSDFGLSKIHLANQKYSGLVTEPTGTFGYIDPLYLETYSVTKESDVYSFGVVLFEVLCGRLCNKYINGQWLSSVPLWKDCYHDNKLDEIIFKDLKQKINLDALETFANIAYQCLERSREERPLMSHVVEKLENALTVQEVIMPTLWYPKSMKK